MLLLLASNMTTFGCCNCVDDCLSVHSRATQAPNADSSNRQTHWEIKNSYHSIDSMLLLEEEKTENKHKIDRFSLKSIGFVYKHCLDQNQQQAFNTINFPTQ